MLLPLDFINTDKLKKQLYEASLNEKNKYYQGNFFNDRRLKIEERDWNSYARVSADNNGNYLGFFLARIDRYNDKIEGLSFIKFVSKENLDKNKIATKDMHTFFFELTKLPKIRKIEWCSIAQNPATKLYENVIKIYNGNIIGLRKFSALLGDGKYYDEYLYEIIIDKRREY